MSSTRDTPLNVEPSCLYASTGTPDQRKLLGEKRSTLLLSPSIVNVDKLLSISSIDQSSGIGRGLLFAGTGADGASRRTALCMSSPTAAAPPPTLGAGKGLPRVAEVPPPTSGMGRGLFIAAALDQSFSSSRPMTMGVSAAAAAAPPPTVGVGRGLSSAAEVPPPTSGMGSDGTDDSASSPIAMHLSATADRPLLGDIAAARARPAGVKGWDSGATELKCCMVGGGVAAWPFLRASIALGEGGGAYGPLRPAASANARAFASRSGPACSSAPPMRKSVSSPKVSRISVHLCSFMPPAGHGRAGLNRPMGRLHPSATAWHSSGVNLKRPPALGKMTASAPRRRGSVPKRKSCVKPPASPLEPDSQPPSMAGCSSMGSPKLGSAASSRMQSKPVIPGRSMMAPQP
mmetsp:Transcript_8996/g.36728  ORF Transcript_8996/g.36728 Transcript_8996/m.36728 type:complete len:403 (+) Transcript_8996:487-1695(+)